MSLPIIPIYESVPVWKTRKTKCPIGSEAFMRTLTEIGNTLGYYYNNNELY